MSNARIATKASVGGLREKLDLLNQAVDLLHQAEALVEQANRVTLEVFLEETEAGSES